jgi:hypothetical protein
MQPHQIYFTQSYNDLTGEYGELTNKDLDFTKSHHFVVGYDYLITKNFRFKFETYYQHIYNVPVEREPSYHSMLNYGAEFYIPNLDSLVNKGTGKNYGVEFTLEKFFSNNYYFLITTSLFEAKYKGSDNIERNSAFNGNYVVNVLGGYEFKLGDNTFLTASPKFTVAGGKRYVPWTRAQDNNGFWHVAYMRLDIRIALRWNSKRMMNEWIMDIQNITNRENIYYESLNRITGDINTEYHQKFAWMMMWRLKF